MFRTMENPLFYRGALETPVKSCHLCSDKRVTIMPCTIFRAWFSSLIILHGVDSMKKTVCCLIVLVSCVMISVSRGNSRLKSDAIDAVRLTGNDIPEGFAYGKIPEPYKKTLKDNPWMMDRAAIKRVAGLVYPGGDFNSISDMHVSIIADKKTPFGDDIVCYVILFNSVKAAQDEIRKMTEFTGFNGDRVLLLTKDNMAVILMVDDISNFSLIQELAKTIGERLKNL